MQGDYRRWLEGQDYSANTISTQCSHATRVEQAYGDLDREYARDRLEGVLASLRYSSDESRRGAANPSKLQIGGDLYKGLASFRAAVGLYRRFRDESESDVPAATRSATSEPAERTDDKAQRIGLERDLQKALRRNIAELELGLTIIDEGTERPVPSGYIDITARDADGAIVVIELKAGTADRGAIGQILSYMGDVAEEEQAPVRGVLVAHDFDGKAQAAARMVPNLALRSYAVRFSFSDPLAVADGRS
jgi:endonuclease